MRSLRHDLRRDLELADYERTRDKLIEACRAAGIIEDRVGFFGSVSAPGVSDLDVLVVGDPQSLRAARASVQQMREEDARMGAILWHEPVYLPEMLLPLGCGLHTLQGLEGPLQEEVFGAASQQAIEAREVLDEVWFTSLAGVCARMEVRSAVSLRLVLLVYKNLEMSQARMASSGPDVAPHATALSSSNLRDRVLAGDDIDVLAEFRTRRDEAFAAFDRHAVVSRGPERATSTRAWRMLGRRILLLREARSSIRSAGPVAVLRTPSAGFEWLAAFDASSPSRDHPYVMITRAAAAEYAECGLGYPFITPYAAGLARLGLA